MTAAITGVLTGGLTLLGVVVGALLGARNTSRQWTRDKQLQACQRLMEQHSIVYDRLADWAINHKRADMDWPQWNHALDEMALLGDPAVVECAYAMSEQVWRTSYAIKRSPMGLQGWLHARVPLEEARAEFIYAARRQLNPRFNGPVRTTGRPPAEDPMWRNETDG
jgi:hypothetical protein